MADGTVLLRRSALGDVVLLGAITGRVAGPVTVVTAPPWVDVARRLPGVTRVVPWPDDADPRALARDIGGGRWIDLQVNRRSRALVAAAGVAAARLHKRSVRRRLRLLFGVGGPRPPVTALYAEACGVAPAPAPWIPTPAAVRDTLVLVPGAAWATKRWEAAGFVAVGRAWPGPVVVLGGPDEQALCDAVGAGVSGARVVAERGFEGAIAALAAARVAVAGDTGLLHLAGACGVPVVALFGPTHPDDGFFVHPGEVVQRALSCRPCTLHGRHTCPLGDHACMRLDPAAVIAAVHRLAGAEAACAG